MLVFYCRVCPKVFVSEISEKASESFLSLVVLPKLSVRKFSTLMYASPMCLTCKGYLIMQKRGEWPSGLCSLRQVTEGKLGRVRSNSGWVTSEV